MKELIYIDENNYRFDGVDYTSISDLTENDLLAKFQKQFVVIKEKTRTYKCF